MYISEILSNFAHRLFRGTLRAPRVVRVNSHALATQTVSESTPENKCFLVVLKFLKVKNGHFKLQDNLR